MLRETVHRSAQCLFGCGLGAFEEFVGAGRIAGHHAAGGAEQKGDRDESMPVA
ncbi:hypothetical protein P3T26_007791 [Streptomyces sp. MAA16]|nr:hypothetical protein [Streptomyces sp. MAA16]